MKKYFVLTVLLFVAFNVVPSDAHALFKSAKITLVVVDEEGRLLEGVDAGVGFEKNTGWGTDVIPQDKATDGEGKATFSGQCNGHIAYGAEKEGYYPSYYDYDFNEIGKFGWEPWNPILKIVMRKIENPVPMYIRDTKMFKKRVEIPVVGKDVGFDLIAYDWVPPYGNGKYADFTFNLRIHISSERDYEYNVTLKFDDSNGIQPFIDDINHGSVFKLPRYAPKSGYKTELKLFTRRQPGKQVERSRTEGFNYIIRVRSKVEYGKVTEAIYGKILGDFYVRPKADDKAKIEFVYYLNPDKTRNLEHDPKRNLFYE